MVDTQSAPASIPLETIIAGMNLDLTLGILIICESILRADCRYTELFARCNRGIVCSRWATRYDVNINAM